MTINEAHCAQGDFLISPSIPASVYQIKLRAAVALWEARDNPKMQSGAKSAHSSHQRTSHRIYDPTWYEFSPFLRC